MSGNGLLQLMITLLPLSTIVNFGSVSWLYKLPAINKTKTRLITFFKFFFNYADKDNGCTRKDNMRYTIKMLRSCLRLLDKVYNQTLICITVDKIINLKEKL